MDTSFSAMNTSGETFEVEKIIAIRTDKDGRTLYKVRWLGFDEADDTWEPYENLAEDCDRLIETFYLNSEGEEGNLNENQIDDEFAEELIEGGGSHEELGEGFMDSLIQSEVDGTIVVAQGQLQQEDGISYEEDGTSEKIVSEESAKLEEFKEGPMEDDVSELQQQHNGLNDGCGISVEGGLEPCGQTSSSVIIEQQQQQEEQNNEVIEDDSTTEKADDANEAYETVEVLTPESWNRFGDLENREIANLFVENRIPSQTEKVLCEIGFDVGRVTRNKLRTVLKTGSASPSPNKKQIASTTKSSPPTTAATKSNAKTPRRTSNKKTRSRKKATAKEVEKLIVDESSPLEGISKGDDGILHTTDESGVVPSVSKNSDSLVGTSQDANEMANETIEEGALDEEHSDMGESVGTERVGKTKKTMKKSGKKSRKSVKNENSARSSSSSPRGKSRGKRRQQRATCSSTPPSKRRKTLKGDSSEVSLEPESLEASDMVITSDNKSDNDSNKDANDDRSCDSDKKSENFSDKMTATAMAIAKTEDSDRDLENVKGVVNDSEDNDRTNAEGIDKNVADSGKSYENSCDGSNVGSNEQQAQEKEQTRIKAEQLEVNGGESNGRELEEATIKMEIKQEPETEQDGEKGPKGISKGRRGTQEGRKAAQSSSAVNRRKRNPKVGRRKKLAKEEENGVVCDDAQNNSGNDSSSGNSNNSIAIGQDSSMDGCSVNSSNNNGNSSEMAAIQNESDVQCGTNNNNSANECVVEKLSSVPSSSSDTKEQGQLSSTNEGNSGDKEGEQKSMDNRSAVSTNLQTSSTQQVAAAASASTTSAKRQSTVKGGWVSLSSCQPSTSAVSATRSVHPSIRTPQTAPPQPATQTLQTSNQIPKQSSSAQPIAPQNQSLTDQPGQSSSTSSSTPSASSEYTDYRARAIASLPLPVSLEPIQQIEAMEFRNQFRNREEPLKSFMALRNAVLNGRVNAVRWTARCPQEKRGFDFNQCFHGKTLAYEICERKCNTRTSAHINDDMLRVLVMGGARLDIPEEHNLKTPLHAAIENGSWCLVRTLLHLRSPVNTFDAKKKTPLHYAIECKDPNAIRAIYLLLEFGADVNEVLKTIRDPRLTQKLEQHQHKLAEALDEARMKTFISMTVKRKITPVMIRSMWESQWSNFTVELSFHFEKCLLPNKRYVYLIMLAVFDYFSPRYWRVRMWGRSPFESVRMNNNPPHPLQEGPNGFVFATKLVNGWNRLQIRYHPFVKNKKLLLMAQVVLAQRDKPHIFIQQPALEVAAESGTDWIKE